MRYIPQPSRVVLQIGILNMSTNPYLLAADNSPALLPLLQENPGLASQQDEHGYSLIHAAASYNHLDLLRKLVQDFNVTVDLRDEDSETALFVVETVAAARVLVEELGLDPAIKGDDGLTAREKIEGEAEFPEVVEYLRSRETGGATNGTTVNGTEVNGTNDVPPVPEGLSVRVGAMPEPDDVAPPPNPELRRAIEELAAREDFHTEAGQAELRRLVEEAIAGEDLTEDRNVRARQG